MNESLVLFILVASPCHIMEEVIRDFPGSFNRWLTGSSLFPVSALEALLKDQVGLSLLICNLTFWGQGSDFASSVLAGIIAADLAQHVYFSSARGFRWFPGIYTSLPLHSLFLLLFPWDIATPLPFLLGNSVIFGNFAFAKIRSILSHDDDE